MTVPNLFMVAAWLALLTSPAIAALDDHEASNSLYRQAPPDWRAEVIPFPLPFAPGIDLAGVEELRFAPGMYEPDSEDYFTYTFVWSLDGRPDLDARTLENHLLAYYRGLYAAVSKKADKDLSSFGVRLHQAQVQEGSDPGTARLQGRADWIDPFVTEKPLALNIRARRWHCRTSDRSVVFFSVSPQPHEHAVWRSMAGQEIAACGNDDDSRTP